MDEQVFVDPERAVGDSASRGDFGVGDGGGFVEKVLADGDLVDKGRRDELTEDLDLRKDGR